MYQNVLLQIAYKKNWHIFTLGFRDSLYRKSQTKNFSKNVWIITTFHKLFCIPNCPKAQTTCYLAKPILCYYLSKLTYFQLSLHTTHINLILQSNLNLQKWINFKLISLKILLFIIQKWLYFFSFIFWHVPIPWFCWMTSFRH